ncbi:hypothetical protein JCM19300_904 [Algibacter lectus]|uniref:Uncharacterized protein n=2 Tax=Algibacter lectus TaxID=221126 RepID=A0A090VJN8_9FLAO|nr:hypothetical protein JCM19300_904 [Algibacter lectus]
MKIKSVYFFTPLKSKLLTTLTSNINQNMSTPFRKIKSTLTPYLLCFLLALTSCDKKELKIGETAIIPLPAELIEGDGHFIINDKTTVSVNNQEQQTIATNFFKNLKPHPDGSQK